VIQAQEVAVDRRHNRQKDYSMQQDERDQQTREAAYRRGNTQGREEAARIIFQLIELGYKPTKIKRLLAVYDDHFLANWRHDGDLSMLETPPPFGVIRCQEILSQTTGYNWII